MYYNGVKCDIYVGTGAGSRLLKDINNAEKSIKIVSPFLSPSLVKHLIRLYERNIDIELITTNNIEDYHGDYEKNIHKLIIQNRIVDTEAEEKRNNWIEFAKKLLFINIGIFIMLIVLAFLLQEFMLTIGAIPVIILYIVRKSYLKKIQNKKIYNYRYTKLFPFKVILQSDGYSYGEAYIHSKIYIIDNKMAYLGSLNFTKSGTETNHETRVKMRDTEVIKRLNDEIDDLFENEELPEVSVNFWGSQLYPEPIN